MKWGRLALAAAAMAATSALITCSGVDFTAPPGSHMELIANPDFIDAHGGISVITAIVTEPAGTPVADGTVIYFFSNLGSVDREGKTRDGIARVNLVADSRSGTARVTAMSGGPAVSASPSSSGSTGGNSDTVDITIGNLRAKRIFAFADPPRITDSRSTHISALVYDEWGNPVSSAPVLFHVTVDPATEYMDDPGPIFTDNNGRAESVMRTKRAHGAGGTATVRASVPTSGGFVTGDVTFSIE